MNSTAFTEQSLQLHDIPTLPVPFLLTPLELSSWAHVGATLDERKRGGQGFRSPPGRAGQVVSCDAHFVYLSIRQALLYQLQLQPQRRSFELAAAVAV